MKTKFLVLAGVAALGLAAPAHAGVIINVNGKTNAGQLPAGNPLATPVTVFLNQGRYLLTFVAPPTPGANWTAANVWTRGGQPGVTGCNSGGSNCAEGWFNRIEYYLGGNAVSALTLGSSSVPNRYNTAALSFANSGGYFAEIIVGAGGQNFSAFLRDTPITDNHGGISLSLAGVPEPATWAMMIMGFGLIGGAYRTRRTQGKVSFA